MATSTGIVTRSRAKILTTTITPYISDGEDSNGISKDESVKPTNGDVSKDSTKNCLSNDVAAVGATQEPLNSNDSSNGTDTTACAVINLLTEVETCVSQSHASAPPNIEKVAGEEINVMESTSNVPDQSLAPVVVKLNTDTETDNLSQYSSCDSAASVRNVVADAMSKKEASKQFDDGYEEDGFILKAKRKSGDQTSNGHVSAVDVPINIDDADMNRINNLFGDYEYEDRDGSKEESEQESILSDPSDLNDDSGPDDEDLVEDDIENYGKNDKPRVTNCFIDDEAVEDNTKELESNDVCEEALMTDDDSDSADDRAIKFPLKKKDFLDEEAVEDNNLKELYGWSDCSSRSDDEGKDWKWNHEDSGDEVEESEDDSGDDESEEPIVDMSSSVVATNTSVNSSKDSSDEVEESDYDSEDDDSVDDESEEPSVGISSSLVATNSSVDLGKDTSSVSSDDESVTRRKKRNSRPQVIDDDDEDDEEDDEEVQVIEQQGEKDVSLVGSTTKRSSDVKPSIIENATNPMRTVREVTSTSSVFTVAPLEPDYQPGRNNRNVFKITPLIQFSKDRPIKRKGNELDGNIEGQTKKVKSSSDMTDDFILGHDLVFLIDLKNSKHDSPDFIGKLNELLKKALQERVTTISIKKCDASKVSVGLNLNVDHAYNPVIKGPSADNDKEVKSFKKFWGHKVEVRRYPDLTILASVHFAASTLAEKRNIVPEIVCHIVRIHLNIYETDVIVRDQQVNKVLTCRQRKPIGTGEEELLSLSESFEGLRKKLRELKNLPLGISSIKGVSPAFRGGEVFPLKVDYLGHRVNCQSNKDAAKYGCILMELESKFIPRLIKPHEVNIELETSGKWPDDLNALRQVKTQILYNLMAQIHLKHKLPVKLSEDYLDVLHESFVFRIFITVKKEVILLRQFKNEAGIMLAKRGKIPEADELELRNEFLPILTSALNGVSTQFITYNTVVRLAKRWLCSQYLFNLLSELLIELIVARVYLSPSDRGYSGAPNSPLTGFLRFLELVSRFKWSQEPLFININNEISEKKMMEIKKSFQQTKEKPPFMICTPYDLSAGYFTKPNGIVNSSPIFETFVRNAKSSYSCLVGMIRCPETFNFLKLFQHPINNYHVVIHLKHEFVATSILSLDPNITVPPNKSNKNKPDRNLMPVTDFDVVVQYLKSLKECYQKEAVFFYDYFGGTKILVYFTPHALENFAKKDSNIGNYEEIIDAFRLMGHGIVEQIKVNPEKWS